MNPPIPDKLYFKIGEVAELTGVKAHVLRYWETEFAPFRPAKSSNRQRLYRKRDIELVFFLKDLLYRQGFTIAGAKKRLKEQGAAVVSVACGSSPLPDREGGFLEEIRSELVRLRASLDSSP